MQRTYHRVTARIDQAGNRALHRAAGRLDMSVSETLRVAICLMDEMTRDDVSRLLSLKKFQRASWSDGRFAKGGRVS